MLTAHRAAGELEAAIEAILARPVMTGARVRGTVGALSNKCATPDARSAEACHEVAELRRELAVAVEATRLEIRIEELRHQLRQSRGRGDDEPPDPVGELFAWMSRGLVSVRDVGFGFPVAFALLIELVSSCGLIGIAGYAAATRTSLVATPATAASRRKGTAEPRPEPGTVVDYVTQRTVLASEGPGIAAEDLYTDYIAWCEQQRVPSLSLDEFIGELERLRQVRPLKDAMQKFGSRYYGVRLVSNGPRLQRTPMN